MCVFIQDAVLYSAQWLYFMEFSIKGIYFNTSEKILHNTTYKNVSLNSETPNEWFLCASTFFFSEKYVYFKCWTWYIQ
jgi:hypothetical protein